MLKRIQHGALSPSFITQYPTGTFRRQISLASAINRGIRKADNNSGRLGGPRRVKSEERIERNGTSHQRVSRMDIERSKFGKTKASSGTRNVPRSHSRREEVSEEAPYGKPYTTAGSEFIYGTFAVKAALEADRRKMHKLYIRRGLNDMDGEIDQSITSLARTKRVSVQPVAGTWDKMLLRMSNQRPHNGVILEASPIPKLPVASLHALTEAGDELHVRTALQSLEDEANNEVFESSKGVSVIPRSGDRARYPLLLWLDRITDTGNLGAIIRTAYFMGVDAVMIPEHGTAPFTPITIKASAGAAELLPIMVVKHEVEFIRSSQGNGWKFIAAVAPGSTSTWKQLSQQGSFVADAALDNSPCVLMVGNEGEGLRPNIQKIADNFVSIRGVRGPADGVESLNVSVAAALLVARMLSKPSTDRSRATRSTSPATPQSDDQDSALF